MKSLKSICCAALAAAMLMTGCNSMTNTGKGALIGGGGGGALGAGIGDGVEQSGLAHIGQSHDTQIHSVSYLLIVQGSAQ